MSLLPLKTCLIFIIYSRFALVIQKGCIPFDRSSLYRIITPFPPELTLGVNTTIYQDYIFNHPFPRESEIRREEEI